MELVTLEDVDELHPLTMSEQKMCAENCCSHFETFLVQGRRGKELKDKDLQNERRESSPWQTSGMEEAHRHLGDSCAYWESSSRHCCEHRLKEIHGVQICEEIKCRGSCRWCVKGFQDPDIDSLNRQSPTLTNGLSVLQILASNKWTLEIADVEGVLQGDPFRRDRGPVYARVPREGVDGVPADAVVELTKCVYGLVDAPIHWWRSITRALVRLGMVQSELDPCVFRWFEDIGNGQHQLGGILALHVDDMVIGGNANFHHAVHA